MGYDVKGITHFSGIPGRNLPEKDFVYVDGYHPELRAYGHIRFTEGLWRNQETEITILPPEIFFG